MFEHERAALARLRRQPWLLAAGAGIVAALTVAAVGAMAVVDPIRIRGYSYIVGPLPALLIAVILAPLPRGALYGVALSPDDDGMGHGGPGDDGWPVGELVLAGWAAYPRQLASTVAATLAGLVVGGGILAVLLAGDAAATYATYAGGGPQVPGIEAEFMGVAWLVLAAAATTWLPLAFHGLAVADGIRRPVEGWQAALRFAVYRPRTLARFVGGTVLLLAPGPTLLVASAAAFDVVRDSGPVLVALARLPDWGPAVVFLAGFAVVALVGAASVTLATLYRVEVYEAVVAPTLATAPPLSLDRPSTRRTSALGLALALVVAAVAGGVAVRLTDTRPQPTVAAGPAGEDPAAVAATARRYVETGSYEVRIRTARTNDSTDEWRRIGTVSGAIDREDRQVALASPANPFLPFNWTTSDRTRLYASDATLAGAPTAPLRDPRPGYRLASYHRANWTVVAWPGYAVWSNDLSSTVPLPEEDRWRMVDAGGDTVRVAWRNQTPAPDDAVGGYVTDRRVTLTVDARTGRPKRVVETTTHAVYHDNGSLDRRSTTRERYVFTSHDADVRRPAPVRTRGPLELLWDLVYY